MSSSVVYNNIQGVLVINKLDSCFLLVEFCYSHSYENRPNWTPFSLVAIINRTPV